MAQMAPAVPAANLSSDHSVARIPVCDYRLRGNLCVETGPSAARVKFVFGSKEFIAASPARIDSLVEVHVVFSGEGPFGAFLPKYTVLISG